MAMEKRSPNKTPRQSHRISPRAMISILSKITPVLAKALGTPLAKSAKEVVAKAILDKLNVPDAELSKALESLTPEQIATLKQAEMDFNERMAQMGVDLEALAVDDRKDARKMAIETKDITPKVIAWVVLLGWVSVQILLFFVVIPSVNEDFLLRTLGTLDAAVTMVLAFYFGSSSGSDSKNRTIERLANVDE